jgi:hypothetical protein
VVGDLLSGWAAGLLINPLRIFFILIAAGVFGGAWIAQKVRKIAQRIVAADVLGGGAGLQTLRPRLELLGPALTATKASARGRPPHVP